MFIKYGKSALDSDETTSIYHLFIFFDSMREFDQWNVLKKKLNTVRSNFYVQPQEIWYVHLGQNV